jgi:hypothetical protein
MLVHGSQKYSAMPCDWSSDRNWILVNLIEKENKSTIALVSVKNGTIKRIKEFGSGLFNKISFPPDWKYKATQPPTAAIPEKFSCLLGYTGNSSLGIRL